ncbi:hypothetical protein ACFPVT_10310 [Corynebacterium choanae]|uniref:Uncharacterized protein n=1 Tax=Corynebacterium choanae TaxID=1862358 RepID=A0A3G6J407_9CORY|nr:hypothetical protein [Corynebacterium choanae]AZA12805.1 hypothetical protein CCHOA_01890 [Corynebacterium choanae]
MTSRFVSRVLAVAVAAAIPCTTVSPAHAATATVIGNTCQVEGEQAYTDLGALSGATGEFFTDLRQRIRTDNPAIADKFLRADQLNEQLAASGGVDRSAQEALGKLYVEIDSAMHEQGYKFGEWRLAFPQAIANNRAFDPRVAIDPAAALAIAANPTGFQAAIDGQRVDARLGAYINGLETLTAHASPRLQQLIGAGAADLVGRARSLQATDFRTVNAAYARAAAECATAFDAAGITAEAGSFNQVVPDLYVPDTSRIAGTSGPGDTGIFAPLEAVHLFRGDSSDLDSDAVLTVIAVFIAIVAAAGPTVMARLPEFLTHPPALFPPR